MPGKQMFCGAMETLFEAERRAIDQDQLLGRLWERDTTLWPHGESGSKHIRENLEFLHFPEMLPQFMAGGLKARLEAVQEGMTEQLLISFGSVHHFCKAALNLHPEGKSLAFRFLESCHPDTLRKVEEALDLRKMFVILVNKSNYQLEDHSLFLHLYKKLTSAFPEAGKHFVTATDRGSYLAVMAREYKFRYLLELPAGILAPYCSILFLGLFLAGTARLEPEVLRMACREMKKQYADARSADENPAVELASFLSAAAKSGRKILSFVAGPEMSSFAAALCPLVGGSLGRGEDGLYPLAGAATPSEEENDGKQVSAIVLRKNGEPEPRMEEYKERLRKRGTPFLEMGISNPLDLLRHSFGWQVATVLCAARLGIDPFEPSDRLKAQNLAGTMLDDLASDGNALQRKARVKEGALQLFAEGKARLEISQLNVIEGLRSFLHRHEIASYLSLFVFLEQREETEAFFEGLREAVEEKLKMPVLLAWGPRSIYTYSYLLRAEAPPGLHLMVTGDAQMDVNVPGAKYKFGQIYMALALGQFEVLSGANGLAMRVHVGAGTKEELAALENAVSRALR